MIVMGILKVVTKVLGSSVFRNIKSKVGGAGKLNHNAIVSDAFIDLVKLLVVVGLAIYALKTGDWAGAEKAQDLIGN